jgi:hypothetical protein
MLTGSPSDNEAIPNWSWMFDTEFGGMAGSSGIHGTSGHPGDSDLDWNDENRTPWEKS